MENKKAQPEEQGRGGEKMKIEIIGEPKEIAALVLAIQERQPQSALVPKRVIEGSVNADHAVTSNNSVKDFG